MRGRGKVRERKESTARDRKGGEEEAQGSRGRLRAGESEVWPFLPVKHFLICFLITVLMRYLHTIKFYLLNYNSVVFGIFTELCNNGHYLIQESFHHPQKKLPISSCSSFSSCPVSQN